MIMEEECYCFKCKDTVTATGEIKRVKNGRLMFKGKCKNCSGKVFKFVKEE